MTTLKLTDQEAWFLTLFFERILDDEELDHIFHTLDENDEMTFDQDFKDHIIQIEGQLYRNRGLTK